MKCYFTFNNDIENNKIYLDMLELALRTARKNTTLDLYALYEGTKEDKLYSILKKYNVNVQICKLSFYDLLENFYDEQYKKEVKFENMRLKQAACNFLKFEIPLFEKEDEIVLYSDIDVLFYNDLDYDTLKTNTLAAAPEFIQEYDTIKGNRYFNAGIMLLNLKELSKRKKQLLNMLKEKIRPYQECWDQGFFNELYKDDFDELPLEYNWKPYWGINTNAKIVHLHGIKPFLANIETSKLVHDLMIMHKNYLISGLIFYFSNFANMLGKDETLYLANLAQALALNLYRSEQYNKKRWLISTNILYQLRKTILKYKLDRILKPILLYTEYKLKKRNIPF